MEFDDSPTTVVVTNVRIVEGVAYFKGTDQNDEPFLATLNVTSVGPLLWWAETVEQMVKSYGSFAMTSRYDEGLDRWYVRAGNYSIKSEYLSFHPSPTGEEI